MPLKSNYFVILLLEFRNELLVVYYIFYDIKVCANALMIKVQMFCRFSLIFFLLNVFLLGSLSIPFIWFILNFQVSQLSELFLFGSCTALSHCVRVRRSITITRLMFIVLVLSCGNYWRTACHSKECRICKLLMLLLSRYGGFFCLHTVVPGHIYCSTMRYAICYFWLWL